MNNLVNQNDRYKDILETHTAGQLKTLIDTEIDKAVDAEKIRIAKLTKNLKSDKKSSIAEGHNHAIDLVLSILNNKNN